MLDKSSKGRNPTTNAYQPTPRHTTGWLCLAMAILAAASVDAAGFGLVVPPHTASFLKASCTLASAIIVLAEGVRRYAPGIGETTTSRHLWAAGISAMGCLIEIPIRIYLEAPHLMDSFLLTLLRNAMIGMATLSHHPLAQGPAVAISVFVFVFSSACFDASESTLPWCNYLSVIFAILAIFWLGARYWQRLSINTASTVVYRKRPWWTAAIALPLALPLLFPATKGRLIATEGWLPTSGGGTDSSPMARDGIGDGDLLVAGLDNIRSFAPIENAPFAASHDATLYDVFDESYNEAVFTKKKRQKVISLEPEIRALAENHRMAKSKKGSREFSTVRKPGKAKSKAITNIDSNALIYVRGRLPLHLKLESFDIYDGVEWSAEPLPAKLPKLSLDTVSDRPWLRLGVQTKHGDPHAVPEIHSIKFINLKTNRVPAPIQLTGVSIDKINRADFFRWEQPDIIGVDRDSLPELTTLHVQSRLVDVRKLKERDGSGILSKKQYRQFDHGESSHRIRRLAERWTSGKQKGWEQIDAIMKHLREEYTLDENARATGDTGHTVSEFLFETKRGPDYLFATSAVWLLRSLAYPARFVTGFYARPDRYEARTGLTPILADDVHCWAEVLVERDYWVTLEPSPGYAVLLPPLSFAERIAGIMHLLYTKLLRHPFSSSALLSVLVISFIFRRRIVDIADVSILRINAVINRNFSTLNTMRTIDRRCQRVGLPRPKGVSPRRWLKHLADAIHSQREQASPTEPDPQYSAEPFMCSVERHLYDPAFLNTEEQSTRAPCIAALNMWSWRNLAAINRSSGKLKQTHYLFLHPHHQ
jgi:hypothetical protein